MSKIEIVGLTTTPLNMHGTECIQYILITKQGIRTQSYVFTPDVTGYRLQYYAAAEREVEVTPLQPLTLQWRENDIYLYSETEEHKLYDASQHTLHMPMNWFKEEEEMRPYRTALIITENADLIIPMLDRHKTITYTSEWSTLPAIIPEDVIVITEKEFPIRDIVLRLPQRTNAIVLQSKIFA